MKASIVICAYNRTLDLIDKVMWSISKQVANFPFEIIFIDDGSEISPKEAVSRYNTKSNIRYFETFKYGPTSPGIAYNIGIKKAKGEVVVLCGADVIWSEQMLQEIVDITCSVDGMKWVVGPLVYGLNLQGNKVIDETPRELWKNLPNKIKHPSSRKKRSEHCVLTYSGPLRNDEVPHGLPLHFLSAYKRELLRKVRGFNEDFIGPEYDDTEFNKRLEMFGCKPIWINKTAYHYNHHKINNYGSWIGSIDMEHNKNIFKNQKQCVVNLNRKWGVLNDENKH